MFELSAGLGSLLGSGLEAGGGLLGSILGNQNSQQNAQNQFFYNFALQQQQQAYQTQMANTQYQRSVADMKQAGLNPMLAAGGGMSLDAAPNGASAQVSQAQTVTPNFSGVGNTAIQGAKLLKELEHVDADIRHKNASAEKLRVETPAEGQTPMLIESQRASNQASADQARESAANQRAQREGKMGDVGVMGAHAPVQTLRQGAEAARGAVHGAARKIGEVAKPVGEALTNNPISRFGRDVHDWIAAPHRSKTSPEVPSSARQLRKDINPNSLRGRAMTYPSYYQ